MSDYLDLNNEELLNDFFAEAEQQVEQLESNILVIESDPANRDSIDEIFRAAHTLKGGSATVEMMELSEFTHIVEDLLDEIRSDKISVNEDIVTILLKAIDVIKAMLDARKSGNVYSENIDQLKTQLRAFITSKEKAPKNEKPSAPVQPAPAPSSAPTSFVPQSTPISVSNEEFADLKSVCSDDVEIWQIAVTFDENNPMNSVGGIQVFAALKSHGEILKTVPDFDDLYTDNFYPKVLYFIATNETGDSLEDAAFISDVTLVTDAVKLDAKSVQEANDKKIAQTAATEAQEKVQETAPQSEAKNEADAKSEETAQKDAAANPAQKQPQKAASAQHPQSGGSLLRVDSRRIDHLLNLVSETVIIKAAYNQLSSQISELQSKIAANNSDYKNRFNSLLDATQKYVDSFDKKSSEKEFREIISENDSLATMTSIFDNSVVSMKAIAAKLRTQTQNLGRITGELQEGVMKIRMVPINQIFSRFPRVVRDLQRELDKKIKLVIEGEDTEMDKSVVDDLLDPIMHCVRNSVDHGVEHPAERVAAGKNEEGTVILRASNEGNTILIEISDDGAGINVEKVRKKAIERGIISPDAVLSDTECHQLIFNPGFSTAEKITNVSGRGVGLDVVKTMIEKLNGTVTVLSEQGKGTTFTIRLPLTLAIIQGLLVRVGAETYSIPIASVMDSHRILPEEISLLDGHEVLTIRDEVISIIRLGELFGIKSDENKSHYFIVIVGSAEKKIGVMVDALIGEEDVVIKPLNDSFSYSPAIAGASILGDGSVSLIIDVARLLDLSLKYENRQYVESLREVQ